MKKNRKFLKDIKSGSTMKLPLMVMKIIFKDENKIVCILGDKTEEMKVTMQHREENLKNISEGTILEIDGKKDGNIDIKNFKILNEYNIDEFLKSVDRPIDDIMKEIEYYTNEYVVSEEGKALNDYFFKDSEFLEMFKRGIGGVSMHHNYIGGLAEHTLNVMYLSITLSERYNCRNKEIAVLGAKLHDIGKIYELYYDGPFKYTLRGEMEGHIVIGVQMLNEAINSNRDIYSEDFIRRIKGCIVQHHGKLEYGSPRELKLEEAFIINYADSIDATMNKIARLKLETEENSWSEYDRRLETKLYL